MNETIFFSFADINLLFVYNPITLEKAKIVYNFGPSGCKRVKEKINYCKTLGSGTGNSEQTALVIKMFIKLCSGSTLFAIPSASFGCITAQ